MTVQTHSFHIGDFHCIAINDGDLFMGPSSIFFGGSSPDELTAALKQYNLSAEGLNLPCTCLYIDTGESHVLIDSGSGHETKHSQLGQLFAGLEQEAISTESITHVILSHGHWDHVGGCADSAGNLLFPNARFVMLEAEWTYWVNAKPEQGGSMLPLVQARLRAIQPRLDFINLKQDIISGIRAIFTPGHTFNHVSFEIQSNNETLICIMDVMDHPLQVEYSNWGAEWDDDHQKSVESRQAILKLATEKQALVHGFHFPYPGLGHVKEADGRRVWQALE